ncbi:MAG: nickel pincer cofactor biosynthesis protein LarC [Desulfomonilaceae bacterium]
MLAYFDCFSGISGDMTLAAMIDAGLDAGFLKNQLSMLHLDGWSLKVDRSSRHGLSGVRCDVEVTQHQPHRNYQHIRKMISESGIQDRAKNRALDIFDVIAEAEARIHGVEKDHVHFHEIGAVDSIIDVVGTAVGFEALEIEKMICSPVPVNRGFVKTAHGMLPTPAPATLEILKNVPVKGVEASIELVTPTGAAIAKTLASEFGPYPSFVPQSIGYGLGRSDPHEFPNALRITVGQGSVTAVGRDQVGVLECQIDDLDPRVLGSLMDLLLSKGALDVTFSSVQMKKNRPGTAITVITPPNHVDDFARLLLSHTTTLGVRVSQSDRILLPRTSETVDTSLGPMRVKVIERADGMKDRRPEFDDVRTTAERLDRPVFEIMKLLERELNR